MEKKQDNSKLKSYIETLGNAGNLNAKPVSLQWAIAVRLEMQSVLGDAKFSSRQIQAWQNLMKENKGFRQLVDKNGKPFKSYEQFCNAQPPFGLGCQSSEIDRIINESTDIGPIISRYRRQYKKSLIEAIAALKLELEALEEGDSDINDLYGILTPLLKVNQRLLGAMELENENI